MPKVQGFFPNLSGKRTENDICVALLFYLFCFPELNSFELGSFYFLYIVLHDYIYLGVVFLDAVMNYVNDVVKIINSYLWDYLHCPWYTPPKSIDAYL